MEGYYVGKLQKEYDPEVGLDLAVRLSHVAGERGTRELVLKTARTGNLAFIDEPMRRIGLKAVPWLIRLARDADEKEDKYSCEAIRAIPFDDRSMAEVQMLLDSAGCMRVEALFKLGLMRSSGSTAKLIEVLLQDGDSVMRRLAAVCLDGRRDQDRASIGEALKAAVNDSDAEVASAAARMLRSWELEKH
jgi:hypothetical protein